MTRAGLLVTCLFLAACGSTTPSTDAGVCSAFTCRGCCDATGTCRTGTEPTSCGLNGFACLDCQAAGQSCGGGACFASTGGGGGSTGGGGGATGGGGGATGGGGGATGGGGGATGGGGGSSCVPESDLNFCFRIRAECERVTAVDNCGVSRTVASCGTCEALEVCGAGGTPNQCGLSSVTLTDEVVAPDGRGAGDTLVRFDPSSFLHAYYVDLRQGDVWHAWRNSAGWQRELAVTAGAAVLTLVDAAWDSTGLARVLVLARTGTSPNFSYEFQLHGRSTQSTWARLPLTLPTGTAFPSSTVRLEASASPVVLMRSSSGLAHPANCRLTLYRPNASTWSGSDLGTWGSYDPCNQTELHWTLDANGRGAIALKGADNGQRWSVVVEQPANTWTRSMTPLSSSSPLRDGLLAVAADGTIHLFGSSAVSSQANRYIVGSGAFWSEEAVTGLAGGGAPTRFDLFGADAVFTRVIDDVRTTTSGSVKRLTVSRVQRTAPNTFTTLPARTYDQDLGITSSSTLARTLETLDPSREPVLATGRQPSAAGRGQDLTDWPAGTQRTVELDWAEAARGLDLTWSPGGTPHALFSMGEGAYGLARLVVRSLVGGQWVESQPVLPAVPGNGNGATLGRLRIHPTTGQKVVLVPGLVATNTWALLVAIEDGAGAWQRYEVTRPTGGSLNGFDLAFGPGGAWDLHVAYAVGSTVHYARPTGTGTWATEVAVSNAGTVGPYPRLVVDAQGTPVIGYYAGSGYDLGLARRASGTWQSASFYDGNGHGFGLELDGQGRACFLHVPLGPSVYELTTQCLVGTNLVKTVITSSNADLWATGRDAQGRFQVFGEEAFIQGPVLYTQGANGWTKEVFSGLWLYELRTFFAVSPTGVPGILAQRSTTTQPWVLRRR